MGEKSFSTGPFVIEKWECVVTWKQQHADRTCAVCRNQLDTPSISFAVDPSSTGGNQVVSGQCGHAFHKDCILRWLSTRTVCPICSNEWVVERVEGIDNTAENVDEGKEESSTHEQTMKTKGRQRK